MANATRMRNSQSLRVYHRVPADGDMATKDIATSDEDVIGLGGQGDFQIEADADVTYSDASKVQDTIEAAIGAGAIGQFIYIKNSGFTTALKTVVSTGNLTVGIGGAFALGGFTLAPGESILLHGLGGGSKNLSGIQLDSDGNDIYTEIIYL